MSNETFGITFQYAICQFYKIDNTISKDRVDPALLEYFVLNEVDKIFTSELKPVRFLTNSTDYFTSSLIKRCPHSFLLNNDETFSVRTFQGTNKMFAPKVVGQSGDETFNHLFGHLYSQQINRENFKYFCLNKIHEILPIVVDYALVSDYNCWFYFDKDKYRKFVLKRTDLPELTYQFRDFSFTKPTEAEWKESNTVKYKGTTIMELQLHKNRPGYKIRLHRENFPNLLKREKEINNSTLGDTAELSICNMFSLEYGGSNSRLSRNSDPHLLEQIDRHYSENVDSLFPVIPVRYAGTDSRSRGGFSKSGVDFFLDGGKTLSVKTNKLKSLKVCPPEIGQPSPATFDLHFSTKGWYEGNIDDLKFRKLVKDKEKLSLLLREYVIYLNECDFLLWTRHLGDGVLQSRLINKLVLNDLRFEPQMLSYSNEFVSKSSVTIRYGAEKSISIGEFQIHSARNSLKFRFNFENLVAIGS